MRIPEQSRFALIDALNAEWDRLEQDRLLAGHGRAEIGRWAAEHDALAGCRTGAEVLEAIRAAPDPVLAALIAVHQRERRTHLDGHCTGPAGSGFAGRIVLQTMLGKIVTMAAADRRHGVDDYVGQLWARIGSYPLAARPRRIAANLALDTLKAVTRSDRAVGELVPVTTEVLERAGLGRTGLGEHGVGPDGSGDPAGGDQTADLTAHRVLRTARRMGLIDEPTRRLLLTVYGDGLTSAEAAERHGLTPTTVRFRCSRAVRRLARHAEEIADAA